MPVSDIAEKVKVRAVGTIREDGGIVGWSLESTDKNAVGVEVRSDGSEWWLGYSIEEMREYLRTFLPA